MATIKSVSSRCGIAGAIEYITKKEKTEASLISGLRCSPETAAEEMETTKAIWGKRGGRTYKHFVQSFHKDEKITPEQAHDLACKWAAACRQFRGFEVLIATHKDRDHVHTHFIVNSVNCENGSKFRMHKRELQEMKDLSDQVCREHGLSVCEKGKTFFGKVREETAAYTKEAYQVLKKAESGEARSYVQDIALAVLNAREKATSREDFAEKLRAQGVGVEWSDSRKYITFVSLERQAAGERCKVRNSKLAQHFGGLGFEKEDFENVFERNSRSSHAPRESAAAFLGKLAAAEEPGRTQLRASTVALASKLQKRKNHTIDRATPTPGIAEPGRALIEAAAQEVREKMEEVANHEHRERI